MRKFVLSMLGLLAVASCALAQTRQVRGRVVDESGMPVVGATVVVKDMPTIGTSTDVKGEFSLNNVPPPLRRTEPENSGVVHRLQNPGGRCQGEYPCDA